MKRIVLMLIALCFAVPVFAALPPLTEEMPLSYNERTGINIV